MTISSGYKYICIAINLLHDWCLTRLNRSSVSPWNGDTRLRRAVNAAIKWHHEPLQDSPVSSSDPLARTSLPLSTHARGGAAGRGGRGAGFFCSAPYASCGFQPPSSSASILSARYSCPSSLKLCWSPETQPGTIDPSQGRSEQPVRVWTRQASPQGLDRPEKVIDSFGVSWTTVYVHTFQVTQNTCKFISLSGPTESLVTFWNKLPHKHNPEKRGKHFAAA